MDIGNDSIDTLEIRLKMAIGRLNPRRVFVSWDRPSRLIFSKKHPLRKSEAGSGSNAACMVDFKKIIHQNIWQTRWT